MSRIYVLNLEVISIIFELGDDDFGEFGEQSIELQQTIQPLTNARMRQPDQLYILELEVFGHLSRLANSKYHVDDVLGRVAQLPQVAQYLHGLVQFLLQTILDHLLDEQRVRLVAHFEHILAIDVAKAVVSRL